MRPSVSRILERYGRRSRNHPDLAAIELGRGCVGSCDFCVLWRQMGRAGRGEVHPHLRVKSPERLVDEIRRLTGRFGRRYLGWVDPCFNAHPQAAGRLAELMLECGIRVGQSAWVRSDAIVRDAASGALDAQVRSGLNEVYIGIERPDTESVRRLNKTTALDDVRRAVGTLLSRHPDVFIVGSFIYGVPGDTPATVRAMHRLSVDLDLDKAFFIPLTPLPGTPYWRPDMWDPTGRAFRRFGFLMSPSERLGLNALDRALVRSFAFDWYPARFGSWAHAFTRGDARKRRIHRRLLARSAAFIAERMVQPLLGADRRGGMVFPPWYDS